MVEEEEVSRDQASHSGTQSTAGGSKAGVHYLAKCVLQGSAILHAVQGHLRTPYSEDIVFGKETSLELVVIGEDGILQLVFEQSVFGTIKDLAILPWSTRVFEMQQQTQGRDLLVVLSDSGKLSFLTFSFEMHRFYAMTHIELSKPGNLRHQLGRMLTIDPGGCFIAVSAYEDSFALFPVSLSSDSNIIYEKILYPPENGETAIGRNKIRTSIHGTIWSMCFISYNTSLTEQYSPILAVVMHRRGSEVNDLLLFGCNPKEHIVHLISQYSDDGPLALNVSAVPHLSGFALLFRMGDALLLDLRSPDNICCVYRINLNTPSLIEEHNYIEESCKGLDTDDDRMSNVVASALLELSDSGDGTVKDDDPMSIDNVSNKEVSSSKHVCSCSWELDNSRNSKLLFCLDTGELYMLDIWSNMEGIQMNISECLFKDFPFKEIVWTRGGLIAGLVEMGDGLILKLEHDRLYYKSSIQNIAPILDLCIADYHDEKRDQMFSCSGMHPDGSLRIIQSGISVEKLLRTASIYQGITGLWTSRMKQSDQYHSFLVLSFVEETRILSVGLSFNDVTDGVGFLPNVCTLACGLIADGLLVQIHRYGVRLCLPTTFAHPDGVPLSIPICTSWSPDNMTISVGAVGQNMVIVATSSPCFVSILGVTSLPSYHYELSEVRRVRLQHEVSCISIPPKNVQSRSDLNVTNQGDEHVKSHKIDMNMTFIIGTHKPSVEVLSLSDEGTFSFLAVGTIAINNALGTPVSGCIPEDVKLVSVDHPYILAGLRNGMLLRFEWPSISNSYLRSSFHGEMLEVPSLIPIDTMIGTARNSSPVILQLIAIRRIGIIPVVLLPLRDSLDADIIILSDRPWLLHTARHSLAYTSVSFQSATHVTPVCSVDCPKGVMFVAENSLHLVEMVHCKRLNVKKFPIGGTPRKVLYHNESKKLLVLRTGLVGVQYSSDICCIDPFTGKLLCKFECEPGETAKCMQIMQVGKEQVLIVGTDQSPCRTIMPSGEAESTKGRLVVLNLDCMQTAYGGCSLLYCSSSNMSSRCGSPFGEFVGYATEQLVSNIHCSSPVNLCSDEIELEGDRVEQLRPIYQTPLSGAVISVCSYLGRYVLASAGNTLTVFGFLNEDPQRLKKYTVAKTRFAITCLKTYYTRIAVGDCRDGILFYSYHEDLRKLEQLYSDPAQRLVADCALIDCHTCIVSDRRGNIAVLSCPSNLEVNESPERNLVVNCSFYMGDTVMSMKKAFISYKLPVDDANNVCDGAERVLESAYNSIVASTLLGSVFILIPITGEEHKLLEAVQIKLSVHPLTSPVLGNDHKEYRGRGLPTGVPTILDGDMLAQFLELTNMQQESVLASSISSTQGSDIHRQSLSVNQVVRLLERFHYALN